MSKYVKQLSDSANLKYVGYNLDTGRIVYLKPSLASQGVKGSVTNPLASTFIGSLDGGQAFIIDPKTERGNWKETLPDIAHEINIENPTSEEVNTGLLDP